MGVSATASNVVCISDGGGEFSRKLTGCAAVENEKRLPYFGSRIHCVVQVKTVS